MNNSIWYKSPNKGYCFITKSLLISTDCTGEELCHETTFSVCKMGRVGLSLLPVLTGDMMTRHFIATVAMLLMHVFIKGNFGRTSSYSKLTKYIRNPA